MTKIHVKKGDEVVVISGSSRGQRGKILEILGTKSRVRIEGLQMIKKAVRKSQAHPEGGLIEREGTIHLSNVMLASEYDSRRQAKQSA